MTDILAIVQDRTDIEKIGKLLKDPSYKDKSYKIISCDPDINKRHFAAQADVHFISEYGYDPNEVLLCEKDISRSLSEEIPACRVGSGTLEECSTLEGVSAWNAIWKYLFLRHASLTARYIALMGIILQKEKPKTIVLSSRELSFSKIVESMAKKSNANIMYLRKPTVSKTAKKLLRPILRPLIKWSVLYAKFVKAVLSGRVRIKNTSGAGARKLLFQNSGRPQLKTIVPVMEEAGRDPGNDILFLVSKGSRNIENCEHGKIRQKNPDDYLNGDVIRRIRNVDRELRKTWKTLNKSSELRSIECRGVPLWDIFGEVVEHLWFNAFEPIAKFMVIAEKILSTEKPDCLIFTDPYEIFGRCLLLSANFKRIPSLQIQYAVLGGMDYRRNDVDKIAVSGEYFKEEILRTDPSAEEKIEVTGQPRYDVFKNCKTTLEELYSRYDLDPGKKVVLFASTCWSEAQAGSRHDPYVFYAYHFWLRSIYTALNRLEGAQVIVKPHHNPADRVDLHKKVLRDLGAEDKIKIFSPTSNFIDLIRISNVVIALGSTTALEAIGLKKPLVVVNLLGFKMISQYLEGAVRVYKKEDIYPEVKRIVNNIDVENSLKETQKKLIKKYLFKTDGQASRRVVELIEQMCLRRNGE